MSSLDFSDRVALVTGAGSGIGQAACLAFARAGASVACVDLDAAACAETARQVEALGRRSIAITADVGDAPSVARYVQQTVGAWGRIDAFANNAGTAGAVAELVDYSDEDFDRVMRINVRGVFLGLKHVLPVMVAQGRGAVVNTASVGGFIGFATLAPYCASKHAVLGLTKSAALGVARKGVRVNAVCPGSTETPMARDIQMLLDEQQQRRNATKIPMGHRASAQEIAQTIVFLASDHASHITGQSLVVDGVNLLVRQPATGLTAQAMKRQDRGWDNRWYALAVFFAVSVFNYLDRTLLAILQVPIKRELGLSDAQMGALIGFAFALFYTACSIPIARLADRTLRKWVIAASLVVWSVMTATTSLAASFVVLAVLRIGVAVGEAGSIPATHSMISDYFPADRRATALSTLGLSFPLGTLLGFTMGGWLAQTVGWRDAFLYIGGAGILLAPLLVLTVREPERGRYDRQATDLPSLREAFAMFWRLRSFRLLALAGGLTAYVQHSMLAWNAPFYSRVFGLPLVEVAGWLALMNGVGGGIGLYCGGFLADRIGRHRPHAYLMVPGLAILVVAPLGLAQYLWPSLTVSLVCGMLTSACVVFYFAPIVSAAHMLVLPRMRALTSAMLVLVVNLIGVGLGPLVTGRISDMLAGDPALSQTSLRYAIASAMGVAVLAAWLWWRASRHFVRERPLAAPSAAGASA